MGEFIAVSEKNLKLFEKELSEYGILYIYAMTGFGKTTQSKVFAEKYYKEYDIFSAKSQTFLTDIKSYIEQHQKSKIKTLIILDDIQLIRDEDKKKELFDLLVSQLKYRTRMKILMLSRANLPAYLTPLQVTKQLIVENKEHLLLGKEELRDIIKKDEKFKDLDETEISSLLQKVENATQGCAFSVHTFLKRIIEYNGDTKTAEKVAIKDMQNYLDMHIFEQWPIERKEAGIYLSIFPEFSMEMAEQLLGNKARNIIMDFMEIGSFIVLKTSEIFSITPFFRDYLLLKLQEQPQIIKKDIYEKAANIYEKRRDFKEALRCYQKAERTDKVVELIIYLSENADGCIFAKVSEEYLRTIPKQWQEKDPRILGAKVMIAAYRMKPEESRNYLKQLKALAECEKKKSINGTAVESYVRTVIACPCGNSEELKENLMLFADYVKKQGFALKNIMPTSNLPSLINGGLDLLSWEKNKRLLYPVIKCAAELFMGVEAVGIADAAMGEITYEQNQKTKAMSSLTKALSASNLRGSIRTQYAVTGIMARIFISEEQADTALEILNNIRNKTQEECFFEMIPNIDASITQYALYVNDVETYKNWMEKDSPNEYDTFYITYRYQLFTKAKVYVCLGRNMEALYIIGLLQEFAKSYGRIYFHIQLEILQAIILYRRNEEWQEVLAQAVKKASQYKLIRVFADEGTALFPLWKEMQWNDEYDKNYIATIADEMRKMENAYPNYLKTPRRFASLTDKEIAVLRLMAQGLNNTQIAQELYISLGTSKFHASNILKKLNAENRTVAVKIAKETGIV